MMLIATTDAEYAVLLSDYISEHHADTIEVSVCSTLECLNEVLPKQRFDVALMDKSMVEAADKSSIKQPMLLRVENEAAVDTPDMESVCKYQRISSIIASVLERYARVSKNRISSDSRNTNITAVWSPTGGVGKTTVALAYAMSKVSEETEVFYLNLETFSSQSGYFCESGKSISVVFEMLDSHEGDVKMLIQGICCRESGITYLCSPSNYDDICILSSEDVKELVTSCAQLADELVIDMSSVCDKLTRQIFDIADKVLIITEPTLTARTKMIQFATQNDVFESIKEKIILVANKGAEIHSPIVETAVFLPYVQSGNAIDVYKTLSKSNF